MKTRILSAIVMILLFVPFFIIGGIPFALFMSVLSLMGLYEIIAVRETKKKFPMVMKFIAFFIVVFFSLNNIERLDFNFTMDYKILGIIIFAFLLPMIFINNNKKYNLNDALFLISSTLFIGLSFNLITVTRNIDLYHLIYLFLISTMTDTFALVTGALIGKHKLAPDISPKKTIEGFIGGLIMGTFVATSFYHVFINPSISLVTLVLITSSLSVIGQLGDLVFSMIKRYYDKKDFSNLIPGHGGILDRFDSLIFIVLAFILVVGII